MQQQGKFTGNGHAQSGALLKEALLMLFYCPDEEWASWGGATYYFEVEESYYPLRQVEVYDSGAVLRYGPENTVDSRGMLSDQPLDAQEFAAYEIQPEEFEFVWSAGTKNDESVSEGSRI